MSWGRRHQNAGGGHVDDVIGARRSCVEGARRSCVEGARAGEGGPQCRDNLSNVKRLRSAIVRQDSRHAGEGITAFMFIFTLAKFSIDGHDGTDTPCRGSTIAQE